MKKIIIVAIIIVSVGGGFATYKYFQEKKESNLPKHQVENKNREFNSPEERREYIKSLEGSEEVINNQDIDLTLISGGFEGIPVYGLENLIDEIGIDQYMKIEEKIILSANILRDIIIENSKVTLKEKESYYSTKANYLFDNYGLSNYQEFIDFITKFQKLEEEGIQEIRFNSEVIEIGNILNLKAIITLENKETISQNISLVKMISEKEYLIIWTWE